VRRRHWLPLVSWISQSNPMKSCPSKEVENFKEKHIKYFIFVLSNSLLIFTILHTKKISRTSLSSNPRSATDCRQALEAATTTPVGMAGG